MNSYENQENISIHLNTEHEDIIEPYYQIMWWDSQQTPENTQESAQYQWTTVTRSRGNRSTNNS